jgi:predicted acyltransferase
MSGSGRLASLDAFRGATVAAMLLVNNPGSWSHVYPPLRHAPWHGWTFTDLIFPCFLWIVGLSMALSFARRADPAGAAGAVGAAGGVGGVDPGGVDGGGGSGRGLGVARHILSRSAILFGLGLLLAAFPFGLLGDPFSLATLRIPGVLQRIALCFLIASPFVLYGTWRGQALAALGLLVASAVLLLAVPVPGHGAGVLEPIGNLPGWIDARLLAGHTWSGAPAPGFDPEGLLSTLPAVASTLLGAAAAPLLRLPVAPARRAGAFVLLGVGLVAAGLVVGKGIPVNKNLWTPSFTLLMAGWSALFYGVFHGLIEAAGWRRWALPFTLYGRNAIAVYVFAGLLARLLYLIHWAGPDGQKVTLKQVLAGGVSSLLGEGPLASLVFAIGFVGVSFVFAWFLWWRRWFIKV